MSHWNLPDVLESLYSFKISQKLTSIQTGKNVLKTDIFKNLFDEERQYFRNEVGIKVPLCKSINIFLIH